MAYVTATRTFYDILEIHKSASQHEIKDAYRRMALKHHPDKNIDKKRAVARFQEVQEAFETLHDNVKRKQYNVQIGLSRNQRPRPVFYSQSTRRQYTAESFEQPSAPIRPDWFWSGKPGPDPTSTYSHYDKTDWGKADDEAEREGRDKDAEQRKAEELKEEKKKIYAKVPASLAANLRKILRLRDMIAELETENKAAETVIENWDAEMMNKKEVDFFEEIYRRNMHLNMLAKELEAAMVRYQKLCKIIKIRDPEQAAEAEQIYTRLQTITTSNDKNDQSEEDQRQTEKNDGLDPRSRTEKANQRREVSEEDPEDEHSTSPAPKQASFKSNPDLPTEGWDTSFKAEPSSTPKPEMPSDDWETAFNQDTTTTNEPEAPIDDWDTAYREETSSSTESESPTDGWDTAFKDDSYDGDSSDVYYDAEPEQDSDEEIILFQSRLVHDQHAEVQNEFWEIAEGSHMCGFCAQVLTVFQCPKYELCGIRVCEGCRRTPVRGR